jgi:GDPmannose 4,6-dehydratase
VGLEWKDYVVIDPKFVRPAEVDLLLGDSSRAREKLKWEPKVKFEELIRMMVDFDIKRHSS